MRLRGYQTGDLDWMYALDVVCFERPFRFTRSAMRRFAEAKKARVVIAEDGDTPVGFVILHIEEAEEGHIGYIITLDVEPVARRKGVARVLMQEAEEQARKDGCEALALHVFAGNDAAIRFYTSVGFARSHRTEAFYGRGLDAWVCHKLLRPLSDRS